jgi:hypothetical protein
MQSRAGSLRTVCSYSSSVKISSVATEPEQVHRLYDCPTRPWLVCVVCRTFEHTVGFNPSALAEKINWATDIKDLRKHLRCSKCHSKNIKAYLADASFGASKSASFRQECAPESKDPLLMPCRVALLFCHRSSAQQETSQTARYPLPHSRSPALTCIPCGAPRE